jgi:hypothetical protein
LNATFPANQGLTTMTERFFFQKCKYTGAIATALAAIFLFSCSTVTEKAPSPVAVAIPSAENLLPSDTLFFLTMPDCAKFRAILHESPLWLFWNDPAMQAFHDNFMARWNEQFVAPLEHDLNVNPGDFADWPQGQFTIAVTQNGWNGQDEQPPGLVLLLDARENSGLLKTNLDALRKEWLDSGKAVRTEIVRGISFSIVPLSSNDIPASLAALFPRRQPVQELGQEQKPSKSVELVFAQYQSLLIAGNSVEAVDPIAAHLTGGAAPRLADNPVFAADQSAQFRDAPVYYGWFNAKTVFTILSQIPPSANPSAPTLIPSVSSSMILNASGLMGLTSVSVSHRESHDGAQTDFYLSAPEADRRGILKIMSVTAKDSNPPAFVPDDAVKFARWRLDGRKTWDEMEKMLADISPTALSSLNAVLDMANASAQQHDPDFDIRKNLIGNLGDDVISFEKAPAGNTPREMNSPPSLFLFSAANPDQAAVALKNVMSLMFGRTSTPEPRDFLGRKIYTIPMQGASGQSAPVSRSYYCASASGYVALTTDVATLETFLRGSQRSPLGETAAFTDAAQRIGGAGTGMFNYENRRMDARTGFALLKTQPPTLIAGVSQTTGVPDTFINALALSPAMRKFFMGLDYSLLPDYDTVSKYFNFSVSGGAATADGITFKTFSPRPPQLN